MSPTLTGLLAGYPPPLDVPARDVPPPERVLIVLDDDPTGTQSVADLPVLTNWSADALAWGLRQGCPAVYVMTNSRSLDPAEAEQRNREVAEAAYTAAERTGLAIDFVSRSDSTLRGHFPLEPLTLAETVRQREGIAIAKERGKYKGRARLKKPPQWQEWKAQYYRREIRTIAALARMCGCSNVTVKKWLRESDDN